MKYKSIFMVFPGIVDDLPPIIYACTQLSINGIDVNLVCLNASKTTKKLLHKYNVKITCFKTQSYPNRLLEKIYYKVAFYLKLRRVIKKFSPDSVWLHGPEAMLYHPFIRNNKIISHSYELYSQNSWRDIIQSYSIKRCFLFITPEINRSIILKHQTKTKANNLLIPNRPPDIFFHNIPSAHNIPCDVLERLKQIKSCKKIIYQGLIAKDRRTLEVVSAFNDLNAQHTRLIIIGNAPDRDYLDKCKSTACNDILFLDRINPPDHLYITNQCDIGIIIYDKSDINNIYCAPNKLYEYTYSNLSIVAPDFPAIKATIYEYRLGYVFDPDNIDSIKSALLSALNSNRTNVIDNAKNFLRKTPKFEDKILKLIEHING